MPDKTHHPTYQALLRTYTYVMYKIWSLSDEVEQIQNHCAMFVPGEVEYEIGANLDRIHYLVIEMKKFE